MNRFNLLEQVIHIENDKIVSEPTRKSLTELLVESTVMVTVVLLLAMFVVSKIG